MGWRLPRRLHRSRTREARVPPGRGRSAREARGSRPVVRARHLRCDDAVLRVREDPLVLRCGVAVALQRPRVVRHPGHGQAGRQLRHRDGRDREGRVAASRHDARVERLVVRGAGRERPDDLAVPDLDPRELPVPCRALRELVRAVLGPPRDPARRDRRGARGEVPRARERRVLPGRAADHDRARFEERDLDRRVSRGGLPPRCDRRRREQPRVDRLGHRRRHRDRHAARDLPGPGVLRDRAEARPRKAHVVVKRAVSAVLSLALAGCYSMAPTYERPAAPIPKQLPGGQGAAGHLTLAQFVKEPKLRDVLARVVGQNRTLRRTALDIESARQLYRVQRAQFLPSVDHGANVTSTRALAGTPDNATVRFTSYGASVGLAAWEIDLFGRLKSLSDAKLQQYLSAVETAKATRISLIAETATAWVTLAADRRRLAIAKETLAPSQNAMELTEQLVGGGTSNRGDYWQASTVFQQARGDVASLTAAIAQDRNALELLAGGPIEDALLPQELPAQLDWFAEVPVGLGSEVLLDRPDVVAAEHDLMAANANIGAARAQFFPSLTLPASGGLASVALASLFTGPAAVFTIAPALALPLFRGGANRANLAYTEAQKQSFVAAYELAIQTAFREVSDALATRATIDEALAAQTALVDASQKAFELSEANYKAGIDTFLTTLVTQRTLYAAKSSLVETQLAALGNRVSLFRVRGGVLD